MLVWKLEHLQNDSALMHFKIFTNITITNIVVWYFLF